MMHQGNPGFPPNPGMMQRNGLPPAMMAAGAQPFPPGQYPSPGNGSSQGFSWQAPQIPSGSRLQNNPASSGRGSDRLPPMPELAQRWSPPERTNLANSEAPRQNNVIIRGQAPDEERLPNRQPVNPASNRASTTAANRDTKTPNYNPPRPLVEQTSAQPKEPALKLDFQTANNYLDRLGATVCRLEKAGQGYRFVCALPVPGKEGIEKTFDSSASTIEEALRGGLEQVQKWQIAMAQPR